MEEIKLMYMNHPNLWPAFNTIIDLVDLFKDNPKKYEPILEKLTELLIMEQQFRKEKLCHKMSHFMVVCGFVDVAVAFYRWGLRETGISCYHELKSHGGPRTACLLSLRNMFLNYSIFSLELSERLLRLEFVTDLVQDIKGAQNLSGPILVWIQAGSDDEEEEEEDKEDE